MREPQLTEHREGLSSARVSAENGNQHSRETQEAGAEEKAAAALQKAYISKVPSHPGTPPFTDQSLPVRCI